jgi:hypothetical protein
MGVFAGLIVLLAVGLWDSSWNGGYWFGSLNAYVHDFVAAVLRATGI